MNRNFVTSSAIEQDIINAIQRLMTKQNMDNISRTNAYFTFYKQHPEIKWAFLASMVSRNAGWNMGDLEGEYLPLFLTNQMRHTLFLTYERANWLIFNDAYPQLLLYHYSTLMKQPLFHLLKYFSVSRFMIQEWMKFWEERNRDRLVNALIINEQNVIQIPVMEHPIIRKKVFHSLLFQFEDMFHFSAVLFPTCQGELYGASVNGFRSIEKRINLGLRLSDILFHPPLFLKFYQFSQETCHTGSRYDYEQYTKRPGWHTPMLRTAFPIVSHHIKAQIDWSMQRRVKRSWFNEDIKHRHPWEVTEWFENKQQQLMAGIMVSKVLFNKKI